MFLNWAIIQSLNQKRMNSRSLNLTQVKVWYLCSSMICNMFERTEEMPSEQSFQILCSVSGVTTTKSQSRRTVEMLTYAMFNSINTEVGCNLMVGNDLTNYSAKRCS